jgi:hypothetical protein
MRAQRGVRYRHMETQMESVNRRRNSSELGWSSTEQLTDMNKVLGLIPRPQGGRGERRAGRKKGGRR